MCCVLKGRLVFFLSKKGRLVSKKRGKKRLKYSWEENTTMTNMTDSGYSRDVVATEAYILTYILVTLLFIGMW